MVASAATAFGAVLAASTAVGGSSTRPQHDVAPSIGVRPDDGAMTFARKVVRQIAEDRYDEAWPLLHPSHQQVASRAEYVSCEQQSPIPGRLVSETTGKAVDEPVVLLPGKRVASRAVPVRVVLLDVATSEQTAVNLRVHAVAVDGQWRWVMPPKRFAQYRDGICPDAPPKRYD